MLQEIVNNTDFIPTHSLETGGDLVEVSLVAVREGDIWQDSEGQRYAGVDKQVLPIPGRLSLAESTRVRLLAANDRKVPSEPVSYLANGHIVRKNGKPWVIKGRAERVMCRMGLSATHIVDGYGNNGPRGREWWIRPRFTAFTRVPYFDNGNQMPLDEDHPYTLEVDLEQLSELTRDIYLWEIAEFGKEWGIRFQRKYGIIGFVNEGAYLAFKQQVINQDMDRK